MIYRILYTMYMMYNNYVDISWNTKSNEFFLFLYSGGSEFLRRHDVVGNHINSIQ